MHVLSSVGVLKRYITGRWTTFSGRWSRAGLERVAGQMRSASWTTLIYHHICTKIGWHDREQKLSKHLWHWQERNSNHVWILHSRSLPTCDASAANSCVTLLNTIILSCYVSRIKCSRYSRSLVSTNFEWLITIMHRLDTVKPYEHLGLLITMLRP